jgi:homopolymeric O-antigen transport system ATP-binding protein
VSTAIHTSGLSKRYTLGSRRRGYGTLREAMSGAVRRPVELVTRRSAAEEESRTIWALRDLDVTIEDGEVVGLIGHNGAGKSTFLKILSRITEPTSGWADVTGRVGSLLEVGTGFHPELTGRENIYLNGSILGMRRAEIRRRFDEIVEFAELERFLDTPVKRYSSGMSVRLAFAVAAHLEPEILLVDEVLAVGDASFQRKSLGKMSEVAAEGRTVLFVSHNLAIIQALCKRTVLLERGVVIADAPVMEGIDTYLRGLEAAASSNLLERPDRDTRGWRDTLISGLELRDASTGLTDSVVAGRDIELVVHLTEVVPLLECRLTISNSLGQPVTTLDSEAVAPEDVRDPALGPRIECTVRELPLLPGRYRVDVLLKGRNQIQDGLQAALFFDVHSGVVGGRPMPLSATEGDIALTHVWRLPARSES